MVDCAEEEVVVCLDVRVREGGGVFGCKGERR